MKRSILVGVLAALMLLAFTACDNSSSSALGLVAQVTAVQNKAYVAGETPVAADFTFTGYTTYGDVVALDSADVTLEDKVLTVGDNKVAVTYQGGDAGTIIVEAEEVTGLTVDASASEAVYYATLTGATSAEEGVAIPTAREFDTTGIVVTAKYDGGEKVVSNDDLVFALASAEKWNTAKDDVVVEVKLPGYTTAATYKIDVKENLIESIDMAKTEDYVIFSDVSANGKNALAYAANLFGDPEKAGVYMTATYQGGEVVYLAETDNVEYQVGTDWGKKLSDYTLSNLTSVTVTARYKGDKGIVGLANTDTVDVDITKDSITDLKVAVSNLVAGTNYSDEGSEITEATPTSGATTFTVTPVMASKEAGTAVAKFYATADTSKADADEDYWTFSPADFKNNIAGQRVKFTVTAVIDGETYTKDVETVLVAASV